MACQDDAARQAGVDLHEAVARAAGDAEFLAGLREIYSEVDLGASRRSPQCRACGACCKFDLAGHRLYVSTGELALLTASPPPDAPRRPPLRCPYQAGRECRARDRRPLGCRVYFCDADLQPWARGRYERFHEQIRRLHDDSGLPYVYVEITAAAADVLASFTTRPQRRRDPPGDRPQP